MSYADLYNPTVTPQAEPIDARQLSNNAGGFVFAIDDWSRLERFLILGSDSQTYYQRARALTRENAKCVEACYAADPDRTVRTIVDISVDARAPKQSPAIYALALGTISQDEKTRQAAFGAVHRVCRTASHLFEFVATARQLGRGWGRGMKRAVAQWYESRDAGKLAFQAIKYRERNGYGHKRLLRTAHPDLGAGGDMLEKQLVYRWIVDKAPAIDDPLHPSMPALLRAHITAMKAEDAAELVPLITEHRLPWEALPTWANARPETWEAMLPHLGLTALIRNLGNMTRVGTIAPLSQAETIVARRLTDAELLRKERIHPFVLLQAMAAYGAGKTVKGALRRGDTHSWEPSRAVLDALDAAFYQAFENVAPTGKRHLVALDVSSSMGSSFGGSALTCREATAALALIVMATETACHTVGFTSVLDRAWKSPAQTLSAFGLVNGISPLAISPRQRLADAVATVSDLPFGGTDCALPMLYALEREIEVDVFVILTDSETWAGGIHPVQALRRYRHKTGIPAKLAVIGMTSTGFSIADPEDAGMMDFVGFDAAGPALLSDFTRT